MTEYNYFCWADEYNNENSFQYKRYRVFNVEVGREEYHEIKKIYRKLKFDQTEAYSTRFQTAFKKMWDGLSKEERQEYLKISHFNAEGFKFITGVDVNANEGPEELTLEQVCKELGRDIKIINQ